MNEPVQAAATPPAAAPSPTGDPVLDALTKDERIPVKEPAKSETPASTLPDGNAAKAAPAGEQPPAGTQDKTGTESGTPANPESAKDDEPKVLSQDELDKVAREGLGLKPKEPNTADHWRKKYEASSTEGKTLAQRTEHVNARLKEMGLKVVDSDEKADLVADETYVAAQVDALVKDLTGKLTQAEKDLALDEPMKFAELVAVKAFQSAVRPTPTISARDIKITDTAKKLVRSELVSAKGADGKPEFPDFESLEPYVNNLLEDETTPEDFKRFMNASEANFQFGLKALYGRVHQRVAPLIAAQMDAKRRLEEKKKAAKNDASLTSEGTRTGQVHKAASANDEAKEIATAKFAF